MRAHDAAFRLLAGALLVSSCAGEAEAPATTDVSGQAVSTGIVHGTAPASIGGFASVVTLEPRAAAELEQPAETAWVGQYGTEFTPAVLVARVGQPVAFSNDEDVIHNVHAHYGGSGETEFNVTTFKGTPYLHTFEKAGVFKLSCGVHPAMLAYVVITPSPYAVLAEESGEFHIASVPAGDYDLVVWNADMSEPARRALTISEVETDVGVVP